MVSVGDWDKLVEDTYSRPYSYQQQDGCQSRGIVSITIPDGNPEEYDFENESIKEEINGQEKGVSFDSWLKRDPSKPIKGYDGITYIRLFWHRNFYPNIQMVANDLYSKGLIEPGDYTINIDW